MTIKDARAAVAAALDGITINGQPVAVYAEAPRQWTLPALAVLPDDPYLRRTGLNSVTVNLIVMAAVNPSSNAYDLEALETVALEVLARIDSTEDVSAPEYTDFGTTEAATVSVPVVVAVPIS